MTFTETGIRIGAITLTWFGLILTLAMGVGLAVATTLAEQEDEPPGAAFDVLIASIFLGLIGGRLLYVVFPPPSVAQLYDRAWFFRHPLDFQIGAVAFWSGGLDRAGILLGALVAAVFVLRRGRYNIPRWLDILGWGVLAGLVVAPFANLVNGQLMGPPAPWAAFSGLHPTPLYASLWAVIIGGGGWVLSRRLDLRQGEPFLLLAVAYLSGIFLLEFLRVDVARPLVGLSTLQIVIVLAVVPAGILLWRRFNYTPVAER